MNLRILSCAEQELADAVAYYNDQCPGLGYEFAAEVQRGLKRVSDNPKAWPAFSGRTRRCITNRFPYAILYQLRPDFVLVVGIMHLRQDPQSWKDR